jgi:hypothetical protein
VSKLRLLRPTYWTRRANILERRRANRLRRTLLRYYQLIYGSREEAKQRVAVILDSFPDPNDVLPIIKFIAVDLFNDAHSVQKARP